MKANMHDAKPWLLMAQNMIVWLLYTRFVFKGSDNEKLFFFRMKLWFTISSVIPIFSVVRFVKKIENVKKL